jgi:hypothetical protein
MAAPVAGLRPTFPVIAEVGTSVIAEPARIANGAAVPSGTGGCAAAAVLAVPASLSKAQFKRYQSSPAKTDYLEFEGRPHLHMAAADWQEVAAAIDSWLDGVLDAPITETEQPHA